MTKGDDDNGYNDDNWRWRPSGLRRITSTLGASPLWQWWWFSWQPTPFLRRDIIMITAWLRMIIGILIPPWQRNKTTIHHHHMADNWVWFFPDKISLHRNCFRFISTWMAHWKWETIFSFPNLSTPCQILRAGASNYYETVHQMTKAMKGPISTLKSWLNLQRSPLLVKPVK